MNLNYLKVLFTVTAVVVSTSVLALASEMDQRIESSVKQSYVFTNYLNNDDIKIQSINGVVTLTGTVAEESERLAQAVG